VKRTLPLAFVLLALPAAASPCRAEVGWPPPGYSVTGVSARDGSHYRGLCALLRDRRHGLRPGCAPASPSPFDPVAYPLPASPGWPASPQPTPQPPTTAAGPRP
jgi:hypothetical protein